MVGDVRQIHSPWCKCWFKPDLSLVVFLYGLRTYCKLLSAIRFILAAQRLRRIRRFMAESICLTYGDITFIDGMIDPIGCGLKKADWGWGLFRSQMHLHVMRICQVYSVTFQVFLVLRDVAAKYRNYGGDETFYLSVGLGWYFVAVTVFTPNSLRIV